MGEPARAATAATGEARTWRATLHLLGGAQQQLVALAMPLGRPRRKYDIDPEATRALLEEAHRSAKEAIVELRELTRGLSPPVLADRGLDAAEKLLRSVADNRPDVCMVDVRIPPTHSDEGCGRPW